MNPKWTAIVLCSDKDSRLSVDPKALYPVGDKLLIDYITPHICKFARTVFVIGGPNPQANLSAHLTDFLAPACATEIVFAEQRDRIGPVDAAKHGLEHVATEYCMVLMGNRIVHSTVVEEGMTLGEYTADVMCPVISSEDPPVHLNIVNDRVKSVSFDLKPGRARTEIPRLAITDAGVFFFRTTALRHHLLKETASNLQHFLTRFDKIRLLPIGSAWSLAIDTMDDALNAARIVQAW